jgi:hypothetical protein
MIEMSETDLPSAERLLISLHTLCATSGNRARKSEEFAHILQTNIDEINQNLDQHIHGRYVAFFYDSEEHRRFYLTNTGIIRVCALFS